MLKNHRSVACLRELEGHPVDEVQTLATWLPVVSSDEVDCFIISTERAIERPRPNLRILREFKRRPTDVEE